MNFIVETGIGTKYKIQAVATRCGEDISIALTGGKGEHIGAVSLACYEPDRDSATVSTITVYTHRDDIVSSAFAKAVSSALKCTVSVSAGVHIDNASGDEIALLTQNCEECCRKLISVLQSSNS